jgi:nucleoside-diphosphate-sugar epimerase
MTSTMQTILGAGGPVSNALFPVLAENGQAVRLVSRRPISVSGNVSWAGADLKDYDSLLKAAKGSSVIFMCAGLKYDKAVWKVEWPLITNNLIRLAKETGARLIFFDNVYMYGRVQGAMTETTPYNPCSVKGEVRAKIADMLMNEATTGNIRATIARAADFYGTAGNNSFFDPMVLARLKNGKSAQWLGNIDALHSFTFIPDTGKALAALAAAPDSDNQIWHLPTAPAITGREFVKLAAEACNASPKASKINLFMLKLIGMFNKNIAESAEMYYQYQYDYVFDSKKFEARFGMKATPYEEGMKDAVGMIKKVAN